MKKFLLTLLTIVISSFCVLAENKADFDTMNGGKTNSSYLTRTSTNGWIATNAALVSISDNLAPTINGKTSAVGTITSPTLNNGIGTLNFNYANTYKESKGVSVTISIKQNGSVVKEQVFTNTSVTQNTAYEFTSEDFNIEGDFVIEIKNNSPSNSSKDNKDRVSIWNLTWTSYEGGDAGGDADLADPGLEWSVSSFAATIGESNVFPTLANPNDLTVSYSSSNESVATIDSEGTINLISGGTTTITAETAATESFKAGKATFALTVVGKVATLTDFIAAAPSTSTIITEPVTVYYQSADKKYTFITDGTSYLQVYSASGLANTYNNGDQLTGISGTIGAYGGMAQMVPDADSFGVATAGTPIQPKVVTLAEEIAPSEYVTLSGVSITGVSGNNATLTDGTNTLDIYNRFALELTEVESATVVAIGAVYNGTKQVYIVSVTEEDVPVELGAILANGSDAEAFSVVVNSEVVFSAKNAEKIAYSVNDAEAVESDTWTPTAVGDYTVKVSATLGDVTNTKTFTITVEDVPTTQTVDFVFSELYSEDTVLDKLSLDPVTITGAKGTHNNSVPKYYANGTNLRAYKGNTVTFSVPDSYVITKIESTFTGSYSGGSMTASAGSFESNNSVWACGGASVSTVVFTPAEAVRWTKITVTYAVKGGSGEEPVVVLGDILYNGLSIDKGHQWSTTLGETITISAENAKSMSYSINGGDAIIVEGSSFTWTAEAAGHYAFTVSATLGNETKQIEFTVDVDAPVVELGEIMYDGVVVDSNITHVAYIGVPVTISAENAESMSYTVNGGEATEVEGSSFTWTAAEADEYSFSVTATLGDNNKKEVQFTVNAIEADSKYPAYVKMTPAHLIENDWSGTYLIVCESSSVAFNGSLETLDAVGNGVSVNISEGVISATADLAQYEFIVAPNEEDWSIQSKDGRYIGCTVNDNKLHVSEEAYVNTISFNADGMVDIVGSGGAYLRYNYSSNQIRFRYYKSSTYADQKAITLYKYYAKMEDDPTSIEEVEVVTDEPVQWYDLNGRRVAAPGKGIYILKQGSKATKYAF